MLLKQYLEQLSPSTLKKMLEQHDIKMNTNSPNELLELLLGKLADPKELATIYGQMTKFEKEVISYFITHIPNRLLLYRKIERLAYKLNRDEFEYGLTKLRRKGILYTLRRGFGEVGYIIPDDLYLNWHAYLFREIIDNQSFKNNDYPLEALERANGCFEEAMFRFLTYIELEEIPITQKGTIHKKHISKITEQLVLNQESLTYFPLKKNKYYPEYPKNIALLLDTASNLDLIEIFNLLDITNKTNYWHCLKAVERRMALESLIKNQFESNDLVIQHTFYLLFQLNEANWYSFTEIFDGVSKFLNRPPASELLERAEREILIPLSEFGWLELAKNKENKYYFRWVERKSGELMQIYVQPNYEILVPRAFPDNLRLTIEHFAELQQLDRMMNKYLITKESILKGLKRKKTIEELLRIFADHSAIPINENVRYTILDWAQSYGTTDIHLIGLAEKHANDEEEDSIQFFCDGDFQIENIFPNFSGKMFYE